MKQQQHEKILHLTIKKEWFDMIASSVLFRNGRRNDSPTLRVKLNGITCREGREEWGAEEDSVYYVIQLGEVIK